MLLGLPVLSIAGNQDDIGAVGRLIGMELYDVDSYAYNSRNLTISILEGYDNQGVAMMRTYVSGGTTCQQRGLSPSNYQLLQTAMTSKHIRVRPRHRPGLGGTRCIIGFSLIQMPQYEDLVY